VDKKGSSCAITFERYICCVYECTNTLLELFATPEHSNNPYGTELLLGAQEFRR